MGDRTYAETSIQKEYGPFLLEYFKEAEGWTLEVIEDAVHESAHCDVLTIYEDEANYGEMQWITNVLDKFEIPYDGLWGQGGEYGPGFRYSRDGVMTEIFESDQAIPIDNLLALLKNGSNYDDLVQYIYDKDQARKISSKLKDIPVDLEALNARIVAMKLLGE